LCLLLLLLLLLLLFLILLMLLVLLRFRGLRLPSCRAPDGAFFVAFVVRWRLPKIRVGLRPSDWFTGRVTAVVVVAVVAGVAAVAAISWLAFTELSGTGWCFFCRLRREVEAP